MASLRTWWPAVLLGLATIGSYGVATYSIGVLLAPIAADTGWSTGTVSAAYAIGVLASGGVAVFAGRALDRAGSRPMFLATVLAGVALLFASASATHSLLFVATWAAGSAAIGGGWYYQATMPATARLYPTSRTTAFSILTLLGALASPIFFPFAAFLADALGWRDALRVLVGVMAALIFPAAVFVHAPASSMPARATGLVAGIREAMARPVVWRAMLAIALTAAATNALILHQVPAMEAAGLSLAAASGYGGARGMLQIPGRLILRPITDVLGVPGATAMAYAVLVASAVALLAAFAGPPGVFALVFAVTAGFSVGLLSPLHGLLAVEVYGEEQLGTLSGVQQMLAAVAGALAPWLAGLAVDVTGSYGAALAGVAVVQLLGLAALAWQRQAARAATSREHATAAAP